MKALRKLLTLASQRQRGAVSRSTDQMQHEWFDDDPRVIDAVEIHALHPVNLPRSWMLANTAKPTERTEETPADA
jgi:hypothetical protein